MKHCLITGAADGIGKALARRFPASGYAVTGIDLDAERAKQTQQELEGTQRSVDFLIADLSNQEDLFRVAADLESKPPIDVLIHNAGINHIGLFEQSNLQAQRHVLEVNLLAPLLLTAKLLQQQRLQSQGSLVFISSLSRYVSYPGAAVYAATKDGLASYARSLSVALAAQNIRVLTVFPGPTRTAHARRYSPANSNEEGRMSPEQLADMVFRAVRSRRRILIPGYNNKLFAFAGKFLPRLTEWAMKKTILDNLD